MAMKEQASSVLSRGVFIRKVFRLLMQNTETGPKSQHRFNADFDARNVLEDFMDESTD